MLNNQHRKFRLISRTGAILVLAATITACSSPTPSVTQSSRSNECYGNRSGCMYEGRYDVDEKEYAEREAARLNRQQSLRMGRRSSSWFPW